MTHTRLDNYLSKTCSPVTSEHLGPSFQQRVRTHLKELTLLAALATQITENAIFVLQKIPWGPKLDDFAVIEH